MKRNLWIAICAALVLAGIASCSKDSEADNLLNTQGASTKVAIREILEVELETAGTLAEKIGDQSETVQKLIISGPMNAADVNTFRNLPQLLAIDLKNATFCSDETSYTANNATYKLYEGIVTPYMFSGTHLSEIVLPDDNITEIDDHAFYNLYGTNENPFESIVIPEGVTVIRQCAFQSCYKLKEATLPSSLAEIEDRVFDNCTSLTTIDLGGVKQLGIAVFDVCSSLHTITLPETLESIGDNCFTSSGLTSIEIPKSVTRFGPNMFMYCNSLRSAVLPEGFTEIPEKTFNSCVSLSSVSIPESVERIGSSAFAFCESLREITLPSGLKEIAQMAFDRSGLESITLPAAVETLGSQIFYSCNSLQTAEILSEKLTLLSNQMFYFCRALKSVTLPESIRTIEDHCFNHCESLSEITLPNQLETIGQDAFGHCTALESINMPENLKEIESMAFEYSSISGDIVLPEGLEIIGSFAFTRCENLISITIPKSIKEISYNALSCFNLSAIFWNTSIAIPNGVTDVPNNGKNQNVLLYLADGATQVEDPDIRNIIVNGVADEIVLHSAANSTFRVPQEFRAIEVTYTRDFTFPTVPGQAAGWRSISLPFTVSQITGPAGQTLAPFNADVAGAKPFWLRRLTENGFENVTEIEANVPYIIAMPNNEAYGAEYNVNGTVTFSARDMQGIPFPATADADLVQDIGPEFALNCNFGYFPSTTAIYVLNEAPYGNYPYAGSVFARNTRDIMPFEAYVANTMITASAPAYFPIDGNQASTRSTKALGPVPSIDDM